MKIREMELLIRVAEAGSMTLAAQQLHLTPAAVSATIQRVESALGIRLFTRTTRSLHPTDEGLVVLEGCQDVVARWRRTLDDARGHHAELQGTIHLAAPADTTYQILSPVVLTLCTEHPKLRVVLNTSDAVQHLHRDAIDMAIRYGPLQDSTLSTRKLADVPSILVAAPAYLAARGIPDSPAALANHRCVTLRTAGVPTISWQLHRKGVAHTVTVDSPLCGDGHLARQWALAGMGIARKSLLDVIDDLEAGRLAHVLPEHTDGQLAIHAVFPSRRFQPTRVRVLTTAITAAFAARVERCTAWLAALSG